MAFDVSALPSFKNTQGELIAKALATPKSVKLFAKQYGIKGIATLNYHATTINFQDGSSCGFTNSGNDVFTQKDIKTVKLKVNKTFCLSDLEQTYLESKLDAGASYVDDSAFADSLTDTINKAIAAEVEKAIWQSVENVSPANNLEYFDGVLKLVDASGSKINISGSTVTSSNVVDVINSVYAAMPAEVIEAEDAAIFVGTDIFRLWTMALTKANLYHYVSDAGAQSFELVLPGANVTVYGVPGLNSKKAIIAGQRSNFVFGTDLESDLESYDLWYSKDNRDVRFEAIFRIGVQVKFEDQVVRYIWS